MCSNTGQATAGSIPFSCPGRIVSGRRVEQLLILVVSNNWSIANVPYPHRTVFLVSCVSTAGRIAASLAKTRSLFGSSDRASQPFPIVDTPMGVP